MYVNEPGEVLAWCTHQPSSLTWRIKQVLRWHQGAVQLLLFKGIRYTSFGGHFPTMWHRLYAFDQATYYLQAIPGYVLLIMPIVYGVTGTPPFVTRCGESRRKSVSSYTCIVDPRMRRGSTRNECALGYTGQRLALPCFGSGS